MTSMRPTTMRWIALALALCAPVSFAQGQDAEPVFEPVAESDFFREVVADPAVAFVLVSSVACSACPGIEAELDTRGDQLAGIHGFRVEATELSPGFFDRYGVFGVPTLLVFEDHALTDVAVVHEASEDFIAHMLWRNDLATEGPEFLEDRSGLAIDPASRGVAFVGIDLAGADLSGADLTGALFSGCRLTGANLRGADLTDVYFARTDLTGADVTGAKLIDARWLNSICPGGQTVAAGRNNPCTE